MPELDQHRISDPRALRALAHPLRWQIVQLLEIDGTATATACAERTGESVASCSYHLNMLAKYGFVEQAGGGQGREKPWKLARDRYSWGPQGEDEPDLAQEALTEVVLDHELDRMKEWIRRESREEPVWRDATGTLATTTFLTAEELAELTAGLRAVHERYRRRMSDPASRPASARPVRMFLSTWLARPPENPTE